MNTKDKVSKKEKVVKYLPFKKVSKRFLFWKYEEEVKDGWEDIGEVKGWKSVENGKSINNNVHCKLCRVNLRVARLNNGKCGEYCPQCYRTNL